MLLDNEVIMQPCSRRRSGLPRPGAVILIAVPVTLLLAGWAFWVGTDYLVEQAAGAASRGTRGEQRLWKGMRGQVCQDTGSSADNAGGCQDCDDPDIEQVGQGQTEQRTHVNFLSRPSL